MPHSNHYVIILYVDALPRMLCCACAEEVCYFCKQTHVLNTKSKRRGIPAILVTPERKQKRVNIENPRAKSRVFLHQEIARWHAVKTDRRLRFDNEVTTLLLVSTMRGPIWGAGHDRYIPHMSVLVAISLDIRTYSFLMFGFNRNLILHYLQ